MTHSISDIDTKILEDFMPEGQLKIALYNLRDEESSYFEKVLSDITTTVNSAPDLYKTDGQGDNAKAILHYFFGSIDVYITEIDKETHECFGYTSLGLGYFEAGYIYLKDLFSQVPMLNVDFNFTPTRISDLKKVYEG